MLLLIFLIANFGCERDDLCPETTATTPSLIIDLYDITAPEELKNVIDLRIQGIGNDKALPGYNVAPSANKLILPLRTNANSTSYKLHIDYAVDENGVVEGNEDIIEIRYTTEEVYVSRACGYKTIFNNVTILRDPNDTNRWIQNIESLIETQTVEDETTTHFNILH